MLAQQGLCPASEVMLTDYGEALKKLMTVCVELNPTNTDIYHMRAMLRAELGDRKGLSPMYKKRWVGVVSESAAGGGAIVTELAAN